MYTTVGRDKKGFTIVELLIVIVVIGILAAITIVAFNGVQNRANDTAIQSDLSNMAKQIRAYHAIRGEYPTTSEFLNGHESINIKVTKAAYYTPAYNLYYCTDVAREQFGIASRSKSGQTYTISSTAGITSISGGPSWTTSCGSFGYDTSSGTDGINFTYGWHRVDQEWRGVFAGQ